MLLTDIQNGLVLSEFRSTMWANPNMESNQSLRPHKVNVLRKAIGSMPFQRGTVALPDNKNFYFLYTLNRFHLRGLSGGKFKLGEWLPVIDFCNESDLMLRCRFINSKLHINYNNSYIALMPNRTIIMAVLANDELKDTDIQIDVRSSNLDMDGRVNYTHYSLKSLNDINQFLLDYRNHPRKELNEYIVNGVYVETVTANHLTVGTEITVLEDTRIEATHNYDIDKLTTYNIRDVGTFYTIALPERANSGIDQKIDLRCYIVNSATGEGVFVDPLLDNGFLHQLTNRHIGVSASIVYEYVHSLGWNLSSCYIKVLVPTAESSYVGNINYLASFNAMSEQEQLAVLTGAYKAPAFWYGEVLHNIHINKVMGLNRLQLNEERDLYPIQEIDRLFNRSYLTGETVHLDLSNIGEGLYPYLMYKDGKVVSKMPSVGDEAAEYFKLLYTRNLVYSQEQTNTQHMGLPVVITENDEIGKLGIDYTITGTYWLPKEGSYVLDLRSSEVKLELPVTGDCSVELNDLDVLDRLTTVDVYDSQTNAYLHPDYDYCKHEGKLVIWKRDVNDVDVTLVPKLNDSIVETGWTRNGRVSVNGTYLIEDPDSFVIFAGDKLFNPRNIPWEEDYVLSEENALPNGVPYTVVKKMYNNFHKEVDVAKVMQLREEHQENLRLISDYRNLNGQRPITDPNVMTGFYELVSPFMIDVLNGITLGLIPTDEKSINDLGLRACIGTITMRKYDSGYDPISRNFKLNVVVELIPHRQAEIVTVSKEVYTFLEKVNDEFMQGAIRLNQYFNFHM